MRMTERVIDPERLTGIDIISQFAQPHRSSRRRNAVAAAGRKPDGKAARFRAPIAPSCWSGLETWRTGSSKWTRASASRWRELNFTAFAAAHETVERDEAGPLPLPRLRRALGRQDSLSQRRHADARRSCPNAHGFHAGRGAGADQRQPPRTPRGGKPERDAKRPCSPTRSAPASPCRIISTCLNSTRRRRTNSWPSAAGSARNSASCATAKEWSYDMKLRVAGINFDHMHMGDLLRMAFDHPQAEIVGVCDENLAGWKWSIRNFKIPRRTRVHGR